jgi:hypothetical protein
MGWLWSSGSSNPASDASQTLRPSPSTTSSSEQTIAKGRTPEEELAEFMPVFSDSNKTSQTSTAPAPAPATTTQSSLTSPKNPSDSIAPFPSTMSCRQAFDSAFYCQSLGGQFNNVYRYGSLKDCSIHWSEFWFCMRTKNKSEDVKAELIQEWYRKKEDKYKTGPSSEDVWAERKVRLERAFDLDPDEVLEGGN